MKIDTSATCCDWYLSRSFLGLVVMGFGAMFSCRPGSGDGKQSVYSPPSIRAAEDTSIIQAVIEVAAGTMPDASLLQFAGNQQPSDKKVNFLPCPGNLGHIAGCARIDTTTGLARPLPALLIMPAMAQGSVIAMRPIAVLSLRSGTSYQPIVIGIPLEPSLRSIGARDFVDLVTEYDAVRSILQTWFLNYLGRETFELAGWHDERYAHRLISEWKINE